MEATVSCRTNYVWFRRDHSVFVVGLTSFRLGISAIRDVAAFRDGVSSIRYRVASIGDSVSAVRDVGLSVASIWGSISAVRDVGLGIASVRDVGFGVATIRDNRLNGGFCSLWDGGGLSI